ncbi:MAG: AI-2E family transporter, partial [Eubacterium sp.]|nr:AI-2E family transporter [Eubacterium sp.]
MKFKKDWLNKKWVALTVAICAGVVLFVLLSHLPGILDAIGRFLHVFRPIFIGIALAYVIDPLVKLFEKYVFKKVRLEKARHLISVLVTIVIVLFLIVLLGFFVVPQLVESISSFVGNIGKYTQSLEDLIRQLSEYLAGKNIDTA